MLLRREIDPRGDGEGADALGAIELVTTEAEQVDAKRERLQGQMADRLGAIAVLLQILTTATITKSFSIRQ